MCGIVGIISNDNVVERLLTALQRLEYRGNDSAGVAVLTAQQAIERVRAVGKVAALQAAIAQSPIDGHMGIAHTRWATHGKPSVANSHPHVSGGDIALVHNGIIENHEPLRQKLRDAGYVFTSETDTEVIVHLLHYYWQQTQNVLTAVHQAVAELEGAYAFGVIFKAAPTQLIGVRRGSPLVVGLGESENFLASDTLALLPLTREFIYLEEGDLAVLSTQEVRVLDTQLKLVQRQRWTSQVHEDSVDKGTYTHFMLKEIMEQSQSVSDSLEGRITEKKVLPEILGPAARAILPKVKAIQIIACGTSYHAGLVARYWIEQIAQLPCQVEIASEFRYRAPILVPGTLLIGISQSGETADTLAALRLAKTDPNLLATLGICNVPESALVRESDLVLMTHAGKEISVASTKAFTTQLTVLLLFTILLARQHGLSAEREAQLVQELKRLPLLINETLQLHEQIGTVAQTLSQERDALFLGRGTEFPIALEGALKLKEISYIHAEGYAAGELKHGPLALVDDHIPVIALIPNDSLFDKIKSNLEVVQARGGQIIAVADSGCHFTLEHGQVIETPASPTLLTPIVFTVVLQLLAYYTAVRKGFNVDQPRNLAKSVTVE